MSQQDLFTDDEVDEARRRIAQARAILGDGPEARAAADRAARDEALSRVEAHAPTDWIVRARTFVQQYLESHETLFCDDLWIAGLERPPEPKAIGPVMVWAAKNALMEKSGTFRPSSSSHQQEKPVWRSLIFQGGES